jgi:perosamine synthetase
VFFKREKLKMKSVTKTTYTNAILENFNFLKSSVTIQDVYLKAIPVEKIGFLLPLSTCHLNDPNVTAVIGGWLNPNTEINSKRANLIEERIKNWLRDQVLAVPDRILFLIINKYGTYIGLLGLNECINDEQVIKIDNVVRGGLEVDAGIFSIALKSVIEWFRTTINVESFQVNVADENDQAIKFFKQNGFIEEDRIPFFRSNQSNDIFLFSEAAGSKKEAKEVIRMSFRIDKPAGVELILTAGPSISAKEVVYSFDAAKNGWGREWSKYLNQFETKFSKYVGATHALATSSCTGALQIALMALGIGTGDEVIVPDETWVATANAVRYVGATPIFADVERDTWNIDANSIESLITSQTKAIIAVHMYGHPARMDRIVALAQKHQLRLIEDAAPAIGAEWNNQRCGSFGDFAAFSFQGAKLLVTGEGGMLVTSNDELYAKAKKIWDQGRNPERAFWIDEDGVKFKMSNIQAALGLAQLERANELIEMKRRIFRWYEEGLNGFPHVRLNKEVQGARSIYWMTSIILEETAPISRDSLIAQLRRKNIDTRPVFPAISQYPIWPLKQEPKPTAKLIGERALNLPSGVCLTKGDVDYICRMIIELLNFPL